MRVKQTAQQRQTVKVVIGELPKKRRRRQRKRQAKKEEPQATRLITQFVQQFPPPPNAPQSLPLQQQPSEPRRLIPERQPNDTIDLIDRKNFVLDELSKQFQQGPQGPTPATSTLPSRGPASPVYMSNIPTPDFSNIPEEPRKLPSTREPGRPMPLPRPEYTPEFRMPEASSSGEDERRRRFERMTKAMLVSYLSQKGLKGLGRLNKNKLVELAMKYSD